MNQKRHQNLTALSQRTTARKERFETQDPPTRQWGRAIRNQKGNGKYLCRTEIQNVNASGSGNIANNGMPRGEWTGRPRGRDSIPRKNQRSTRQALCAVFEEQ
jgi:hypothetical protein